MKITLVWIFFSCGFLISCRSAAPTGEKPQTEVLTLQNWSGSMRTLQESLSDIEPVLFNTQKFNDPANQDLLKKKIHQMAFESKNVVHDPSLSHRDPTVRFVAEQFSEDLQRADNGFNTGRKDYSRYELLKVTHFCVECHTRTQQGPAFMFSKKESFFKDMWAVDQAQFLIASRKISPAYDLLLKYIGSPLSSNEDSWQIDKASTLAMQIAVQYQQDPKWALSVIEKIEANKDVPYFLKAKARAWKESVSQWMQEAQPPTSLADLQILVKNHQSEVEPMRAIPKLLKILSSQPDKESLGEALFLAGKSYELLNEVSSLDLNENYYEACVHQVPHSAIAKKCMRNLENSVVAGYSGSSGTHIPIDVQIHLDDLSRLAQ